MRGEGTATAFHQIVSPLQVPSDRHLSKFPVIVTSPLPKFLSPSFLPSLDPFKPPCWWVVDRAREAACAAGNDRRRTLRGEMHKKKAEMRGEACMAVDKKR